ncbi:MAG: hypothetical protein WKF60_07030, partial [Ilumatobacter sp.]
SPAQLGVSQCPCSGLVDRHAYDLAVATAARAFDGDAEAITRRLSGRMADLGATQRFEEAALVRDRLSALLGAIRRQQLTAGLIAAERCVVRRGAVSWVVDRGRLVDVTISGEVARALPVDPPETPVDGRPLRRAHIDEALCLAKYFDKHAARIDVVSCTGSWRFPLRADIGMPTLEAHQPGAAVAVTVAPS